MAIIAVKTTLDPSKNVINKPHFLPSILVALVAPGFPDPTVLISIFFTFLTMIVDQEIQPIK
ncbi:Uncharacterised protein [Mycoplasma putrefaciens]|nr:Uncharacterised protein [Mycoplasma putrefaciens]